MAIVLHKIGLATPLGHDCDDFVNKIEHQTSVITSLEPLALLACPQGSMVQDLSIRSIIKKRKEIKLYTRAAKLALLAAYRCVGQISKLDTALFVAVGREPPDEGSAEKCLIASQRDGIFDESLLADKGRSLYPPLLPLRTLPNMILAHISIQLEIMGENACWAGGEETGIQAFQSGFWAIKEGRCTQALVGAADSFISLGAARDLHRTQIIPPSEAGVFFLLKEKETPEIGDIVVRPNQKEHEMRHYLLDCIGYAGAAQQLLELVFSLHTQENISWGGLSFQKQLQ
ncbi:MAG: hypothetical protein CL916_03110 [Deltaproteobacteria bacterium]|nr:hypothetical protein [Deltaproteobacteria bacterium]